MTHHVPTTDEAVSARKKEVEGHTESHGHSRAAWTGVVICLVGALAGCIGMVIPAIPVVITGLVVMAVSGPVTIAMSRAGYGARGKEGSSQRSGERIR